MKFWQSIGHLARKWFDEIVTGNWKFTPSDSTSHGLEIEGNSDSGINLLKVTQTDVGRCLFLGRDIAAPSRTIFEVVENHASSSQNAVKIQNDGTGNSLLIDQNGNSTAVEIDSESTSNPCLIMDMPSADGSYSFVIQNNSLYKFAIKKVDAVNDDVVLRLGSYFLWVDSTGDLRIDSSTPTSDTDGTVVGTQT